MEHDFEYLVSQGVFEFAGVDPEDGENLWTMNEERAKVVCPEIYWAERNTIDLAVQDAINEGYLEWDIDPSTLEETLSVTEVGAEVVGE